MEKNILYSNLKEKLINLKAKVAVIGLGYVGLPLAIELSKKGYQVYGIDINEEKISRLQNMDSYISGINKEDIHEVINSKKFIPTNDFSVISSLDSINICVPTPLTTNNIPDMSYIQSAVEQIKEYMHKELLIILESTTYPGTTEDLIEYELLKKGYKVGEDYFLCFSPERVDPGNIKYNTKNIPKVIGGKTHLCTELATYLYKGAIHTLVPVSSPKIAEMSKLLENTFRSVNIAFINEMAMLCEKLGINIWEVIDAASTKPFGFMQFSPGPGIGGHCIPLDPMYLSWKARGINFYSHFIELSHEINRYMPEYVLNKIGKALNNINKPIRGSKILILGMAYKPNIADLRESPSLYIYKLLKEMGAFVEYNDPYAVQFTDSEGYKVHSTKLDYQNLSTYDCIILLTNHEVYNYEEISKNSRLIIDTRNAFKNINKPNIVRIGDSMI
jgi:UDP-N-acetyl-D-glucosamine dehydrogenase